MEDETTSSNCGKSLSSPDKIDKTIRLKLRYKNFKAESSKDIFGVGKFSELNDISNKLEYIDLLEIAFNKISPLIYLTIEQRKNIKKKSLFIKCKEKCVLYSGAKTKENSGEFAAFILIKGEIHFFNNDFEFRDLVDTVSFFGYDGPIFRKRTNTVIAEKDTVIAVIMPDDFINNLMPFSKFCTYISRNIIYRDKVLDALDQYKTFILTSIGKGQINMKKLLDYYVNIDSCLHTKANNNNELDIFAWVYSLNRLPQDVFKTFIYVLVNKPPKMLALSKELSDKLIPKVKINARNRDAHKYLDGKGVIIVRELETDVLDFISNLCIHLIEGRKMRKIIHSPLTISKLHEFNDDFEKTFEFINNLFERKLTLEEKISLKKFFGVDFSRCLIDLSLHYQDYFVSIHKSAFAEKDPVEYWIQGIWETVKTLLKVDSSIDEIDDLVVDIIQGSKRTLLGCLSPYIFKNKDAILTWAKENNIQTITKEFLNESDRLLAMSFHYFKAFPEKKIEQQDMERDCGIFTIKEHYSTGVHVLLLNPNRLDPKFIDPNININPISKYHIIFHIGYTFGAQSSQIIKPLIMLFGSKARSFNFLGKAGGLYGKRTEIIVASKIFYDKTHEIVSINHGKIYPDELKIQTQTNIYIGPMLTATGTIIQNFDLLHFYKYVMGCVGIEMDGYFFAKEIENSIKYGLLKENFITRCIYYISDLPLDLTQNLCQKEDYVSWDEGVCSMNAIQRYILNKICN